MEKKPIIVVWFSCGAASAVAAKLTLDKYGKDRVVIANNQVQEEDLDNRRFLKDIEKWLNHPIIDVSNKYLKTSSAKDIWEVRKYMSGTKGAPCTSLLKREARYQFELEHNIEFHVMGFCIEEQKRHDRFVKMERENLLPVLIDAKLTKTDCFNIISQAGIELPLVYRQGYPNANCIGCVKSTSPTYWNHVRNVHPEIFKERAIQSREIGCRLVRHKGNRLFLDELPIDAKGRKMKSAECSIFCEQK